MVWREFLGLERRWIAEQFKVKEHTVRRWERRDFVPQAVEEAMNKWVTYTSQFVSALTVKIISQGVESIVAPPDNCCDLVGGMPASWHRMVSARVAERTGLVIVWKD